MSDNQQSVRLLLEFDQAISWPEAKSVTNKALTFFDTHLNLERVSITLNNIQHQSVLVYTKDTSIPHLASGDTHTLTTPTRHTGDSTSKPKFISNIASVSNPSTVVRALMAAGIQSYFNVPLVIGEEVVGSLNIGSRKLDGVSPETQEIIVLLSGRLSLALFHARLHDDLKQKEAALEASEKGQRELIDQAADVIFKADLRGNIIQANIAATRMLGYSNNELLTMNLSDLFEPDILIRKPLRYDLLDEGLTVMAERAFRTRDGSRVPVEMNSRKLSDGTLVSIVRDLTERNITNELLSDQKNQISALLDANPAPMYAKDPQGRYTMLNDAYLKYFGQTREEMLGKTATEVWPNESARQFEKDDQELLQHNQRQSYSTQVKNAAGADRLVLLNKARFLDAHGETAGFVGTFMDYTDLKAAEKRYQTLFDSSPDPIVVHDGKVILAANQAAINFFKTDDPNKYFNSPISDLIHPDSIEESSKRVKAILSSKAPNAMMNQKFIIATGEVRDVEVMAVAIEYQGDTAIMTSFRDITRELATRQALENSEAQYRRVFKHSPTAMVLHDNGFLLDANQAALDFAGAKSLDEVMGIDLLTMVHPDFRKVVRAGIEHLLEAERPVAGVREHKYLTLSGEERWVEGSGVSVKQGDKTLILLSFNDIHEKVTARKQLEHNRQQLEDITAHLTSYLFLVDLNLTLMYVNQAAARLLHSNSSDLLGTPLKGIVPVDQVEVGLSYLPELMEGNVCSFHHHYVSNSWGELDFVITLIPVKEDDDQVRTILVQMDDVTEIESARLEIAENKELLELIVDTIPGLFSYADMNEKYLYVNKAYANWYGYDKSDVIGKTFAEIIPADVYSEFKPHLSKIPKGKQFTYSQTLKSKEGRDHIMDIHNLPHFDQDNKPKAFLTSIQDVTASKEHETFREALRRLARKLTVSLEPREVAVIAAPLLHDLFGYDAFALYKIDQDEQMAVGLFAQDTFSGKDKLEEIKPKVYPVDQKNKSGVFILAAPMLLNRNENNPGPTTSPFGDITRRSMSLVFVPIFWEGVQIGLFSVQSYTPQKFQEDDLPKLKIFANQIGGALVRAQADALIQEQTRELKEREGQLQLSVQEKDVLLKEVYHRTKNNMQVIVGLLEMQGLKTQSGETQAVLSEMTNRIYSMSMVHELLYRSRNLAEIKLDAYLELLVDRLISAYKTSLGKIILKSQAGAIPVNIQVAIPLGLVINEIVSNALKYAFPDHRDGEIHVKTKHYGKNGLIIEIRDNGIGLPEGASLSTTDTLGMRIIEDIVDLQLFGELKISDDRGVKYLITIPNLKLD